MAQAFVTSYRNQFRWYDQAREQPYVYTQCIRIYLTLQILLFRIDPDKLTKFELEGDIWFLDLNGEVDEEVSIF